MFYLVTKRTNKGLEEAKQKEEDKVYGTREKSHWNPKIWSQTSLVTSETFENPEPIRAWFKKNRANFCGGTHSGWDAWLNGVDSINRTLNEDETYKIWFMECEEFHALNVKQRESIGLTPQIPTTRV